MGEKGRQIPEVGRENVVDIDLGHQNS